MPPASTTNGALRRVGFIGLGFIGEPMARNLIDRFDEATVYDLRTEAIDGLVKDGARGATSCREVAERADVVGVCVVDDRATEAVVAGDDGLLAGAAPGCVIAIHGTVHPDTVRRLAERAAAQGVSVIDAQMTGGPAGAEQRQLRYMVGGDPAAIERARPYLEASAAAIVECGEIGSGAVAKLCNNLAQFGAWHAILEADRLAEHSGLGREKLLEVLDWLLNDNARAMLMGRAALAADPTNAFLRGRFEQTTLLAEKDLDLALEVGRSVGVSLPATASAAHDLARMFAIDDPKKR